MTIVVSAVNLRKGGTLTILRQCLEYLSLLSEKSDCRVIALVHDKKLADYPHIEYLEFPSTIKGWINRLWCEYVEMHKISKRIGDIDLWLSLHDTTPRVKAKVQAVYCHSPFSFHKIKWSDLALDPKIPLFGLMTRYIYGINQKRNRFIIVQQEWLRQAFVKMFDLQPEQIILARPNKDANSKDLISYQKEADINNNKFVFFYAATADVHKDFQTLCRATEILEKRISSEKFEVIITVSGDENKYARYLKEKWENLSCLRFAGLMDKPTLYGHYRRANCFVFTSRIETWGLPISEYIEVHEGKRPIIVPDLEYAHETSEGGKKVAFFRSEDHNQLADLMEEVMANDYSHFVPIFKSQTDKSPLAQNWEELFSILIGK